MVKFAYMALPPRDQRHQYLRFEGLEYTDADIMDFEEILGRIYGRGIHRVLVLDFESLPAVMSEGLTSRMLMEHRDDQGQSVFTSHAWRRLFKICFSSSWVGARHRMSWRQFILALGHIQQRRWRLLDLVHTGSRVRGGDLSAYWVGISFTGDFMGAPPSYTHIRDPILRLCHRLITCNIAGRSQALEKVTVTDLFYLRGMDVGSVNIPYLLARYLRMFASGRKRGAMISEGQFVAHLAEHFGMLTKERLQGLMVIVRDLFVIDMAELVMLQICEELDDTWAWIAPRPERQQVAAAGAPEGAEDVPLIDEGAPAVPAPIQAPQPPPTAGPAQTMAQRLGRLEEDFRGLRGALASRERIKPDSLRKKYRLRSANAMRRTTWFDLLLKSNIDQNEDHILGPSTVAITKKLKEIIQNDELTIADLEGACLEKLKLHYC
ncbi:hypothetical protein Tco_0371847 [Tanacetum coccineum]